jgi:hypothetical protein
MHVDFNDAGKFPALHGKHAKITLKSPLIGSADRVSDSGQRLVAPVSGLIGLRMEGRGFSP